MNAVGAEFYDALLDDPTTVYLGPVAASPYLPMYLAVADLVPPGSVVELGCGTGRLAAILDRGPDYLGIDFAPRLLAEASRHVPNSIFWLADLRTDAIPQAADTYVATEVLEHLDDDLGLIERLPIGSTVVLSVPSFPSESHVRHFPGRRSAADRYGALLMIDFVKHIPIGTEYFHVLRGVRR